jgi:xylan 1,4-beta-xylosidase
LFWEEVLKIRLWVLKSSLLATVVLVLACFPQRGVTGPQPASDAIVINLNEPTTPFPHFWERMFGSGRAALAMRANYLRDLSEVKRATGFDYVRFHGIFNRGVGVFHLNAQGQPVYNFSYVDQIYDGLLARGVRPFVELSFMPPALSAQPVVHHVFWYHPVVSPPKSWALWDGLIEHFAQHLIERYGIAEVSKWYFEVWNEPNLDFWAGDPKQATYFQLYDHTARALKKASPLLRVGGPATAQSAWIPAFLDHVAKNHVPVDFVSTHIYGQDPPKGVFGVEKHIPITKMVCMAARKVHNEVTNSPLPNLPIFYTEYNATFRNDPQITDSLFMGPWLADTIRQCDGLTEAMSYWTFSDVFEEQGIVKKPFYGGFGLIAADNLPKPSFNAFKLLHRLGTRRIPVDSNTVLATRRADGTVVAAAWNLVLPGKTGTAKELDLQLKGISSGWRAYIYRLDAQHGSLLAAYKAMGSPRYPTPEQVESLRNAAKLPPPEVVPITGSQLALSLPPDGLAVVEFHAPGR